MSLADNVKFLRERLGMTQVELGEKLGKGQTTIQKIESGQTLRPRFINEMAEVLGVDIYTLEHGDAQIFFDVNKEDDYRNEPSVLEQMPNKSVVGVIEQYEGSNDTHIEIERYDVQLAAGTGTAVWIVRKKNDDPILFRKGWYKARRLNPENLRGMYVRGDSMEPYLYDHDTVLIDVTDTEIADGEVYAIVFKNRFYVKELRTMEGGVRIISRNDAYEPMEAPDADWQDARDFQVLGRVVWRGG